MSLDIQKPITFDPLGDGISRLELISASDLIDKRKYTIDQMPLLAARISSLLEGKTGQDENKDRHLGRDTLAQNRHMSPFEHILVTVRVIIPMAMRSEWHRHRTQSYNEMSMRYLKGDAAKRAVHRFYVPTQFRKQSKTNKQGSAEEFSPEINEFLRKSMLQKFEELGTMYEHYVEYGVATEQARGFNPVFQYTEFYASALLRNWYAFYELRADEGAQWEIRQYAYKIGEIMKAWFPETWGALAYWKSIGLSNEELDLLLSKLGYKEGVQVVDTNELETKLAKKLIKLRNRP
jgi:thymidylate synthase (FAD)